MEAHAEARRASARVYAAGLRDILSEAEIAVEIAVRRLPAATREESTEQGAAEEAGADDPPSAVGGAGGDAREDDEAREAKRAKFA